MNVGFTGTQVGMSVRQRNALRKELRHWKPTEFHHGDCIGADAEAHDIVREELPLCTIVIHPPTDPKKRAFCKGDIILEPKPYLDRNHDIVDAVAVLVAAPKEDLEVLRSGTWATIRYARKKHKLITQLVR